MTMQSSSATWQKGLKRFGRRFFAVMLALPIAYVAWHTVGRAQEAAVKEGLVGRFWTLLNWTNWRVVLPVGGGHQEQVAGEIVAEVRAGRLAQLLVTNWPTPELNHTVVAYAYHATDAAIDFSVYDPNDPASPGLVSFERRARRFWATRVYDTRPGRIRAFRMYYSPWL